jgi:hypothetical protein
VFPAADPQDYEKRVLRHLKECRPKEYARRKKDGSLNSYANSLAEGIADWVNSQLPKAEDLKSLGPAEQAWRFQEARMFAESDALREYFPRDETTEKEIGPNGGYVDRIAESLDEDLTL